MEPTQKEVKTALCILVGALCLGILCIFIISYMMA